MAKLVFGCGYLGLRVATRWGSAGDEVYAVTRSRDRAAALRRLGFRPLIADVTRPDTLGALPVCETVLYSVGFDRGAGHAMSTVYVDGLHAALRCLPSETGRIIYISSTGVYGQTGGEWVDEDSECRPAREGGRVCLAAEEVLAAHPLGHRAVVLRLAGIYGPGRIPRGAEVRAKKPLEAAGHEYLNLIHVEDAVEIVLAAEARATTPATYVVADGCPVLRSEYYAELMRVMGQVETARRVPADAFPARARSRGSKRVRVDRLRRDLGVPLKYPTFREGLAASVALCNG